MADHPTITEADRAEIQNRINQSLDSILNGPATYWPDGGRRSIHEILKNLEAYRLSLPTVWEVDDPSNVYQSILVDLNEKLKDFGTKLREFDKFPDNPDIRPPFGGPFFDEDDIERKPPGPLNPPPSQKESLDYWNNPISFENRDTLEAVSGPVSDAFPAEGAVYSPAGGLFKNVPRTSAIAAAPSPPPRIWRIRSRLWPPDD